MSTDRPKGSPGKDYDKTIELSRSTVASLDELRRAKGSSFTPTLLVIAGPALGRMYPLSDETVIGRSHESDVTIVDDGISRKHCKIVFEAGQHTLVDLGSTNGVFVNGNKTKRQLLQDGDRIRVGSSTILKYSLQDALEENFQKRMYDSAVRDALTEVYNKRFFQDTMKAEYAYYSRHNLELSVVMLDVDHFKKVNDTHGHPAGDYVLKIIAKLLARSLRTEDVLCRYGGEEFAVVLRSTGSESAQLVCERMRRSVANHEFVHEGQPFRVTISLGFATLKYGSYRTPEDLVRAADAALYLAKQSGRNRTICAEGAPPGGY